MQAKTEANNIDKLQKHPEENSNVFSNLFFCWTIPLFRKGLKKELSDEDIYQTLERHDSSRLVDKLEEAWNEQKGKSVKPSLWKAIWKIFKWDFMISMGLYFMTDFVLRYARPLALGKLMGYYLPNQTDISKNDAIIYASIIVIATFTDTFLAQIYIIQFQQISMTARVACTSLIYRKSLRLSKRALNETTVGHIINLLTNDMQQFLAFWGTVHGLWAAPFQAILILYFLYIYSGPTALIGVIFIVILMPMQLFVSKKSAFYRLKVALKTDERIRYMNEIISGIQVIKVYAWELSFIKLIDSIRRQEIRLIKFVNYLDTVMRTSAFFVDRTALFLCILAYVLMGNSPNAQYVFIVQSFYKILMWEISLFLPEAVSRILRANVSLKRFESFLDLDEVQNQIISTSKVGLKINKASAKWSNSSAENTLTDINFDVPACQLVAIIGPIGSGKSSLLQLCLDELPLIKGTVEVGGTTSYASQEPWLFGGTVKQNILFGQPLDMVKYNEVLKVCALEEDIAQFPYGDNTIVGERGILLSGGQKARINLARAVYKEADIYLLDDPLSAVDASVGKHIFKNCITSYLKNKCTILVTHQVQYLPSVDKIYLMVNGTIAAAGSYSEIQASGENFTKLLNDVEKHEQVEEPDSDETTTYVRNNKEQDDTKETRGVGKVASKVYTDYIRAGGSYFNCLLIAFLFIFTESFSTGADYYIAFWVNLEQKRLSENVTSNYSLTGEFEEDLFFTQETCIYFYAAIILSLIVFTISCSLCFVRSCMVASVYLHNNMFSRIVYATMRFFYTNSSGRILNRFSKDIGSLDEIMPPMLMDAIQIALAIVCTVLAVCIVSPWSLIPTVIIFVIMYFLRIVFLGSSRSIKRIESTKRSPIFAHLAESMKGLTTIRAYGARKIVQKEFNNLINVHTSVFYMYLATSRAFALWLDSICALYFSVVVVLTFIGETYGGNVGFIITQGMSMTSLFQWGIRRWSELENQMTSVERVIEYTEVDRESDSKTKNLLSSWPDYGKIEFKSIFMQYSPSDPYVLKNLNLLIEPKEKVGIVGRTGAGKSSLVSVLFRLVNFEGNIMIDDIDTKEITLLSLRSKISIIPQEPILFSGSVRKNLDPFDQYQDDKIWNVLEEVELKQFIDSLPSGLSSHLSEGGSNFSVGQKQLICLARALLRDNKILILDEATANVDPHTDELLQKTIRRNFEHCTVLTIAHRLHTIMDSDKVLVMDDGVVVEFDHPYTLLQRKGVFHELLAETGKNMSENLLQISQKNYVGTNNVKLKK